MDTVKRVKKLSLTAKGSFRVLSAKDVQTRCGPIGMPRLIQYTVVIGSRTDMLDERKFIIDWRDIFKSVAHHYKYVNKFPSCETFADEICDIVNGLLDGRCLTISVDVGIEGLPAHMTAEWDREDESKAMVKTPAPDPAWDVFF